MNADFPPDSSPPFAGPVKHSVTIAGHRTSISLEPVFWKALLHAAAEESVAVNGLVARIDEARIAALSGGGDHPPANLASAIRTWLWDRYCRES